MLWAGPTKDGKPGYAAWDLYRVEDSDLVGRPSRSSLRPC